MAKSAAYFTYHWLRLLLRDLRSRHKSDIDAPCRSILEKGYSTIDSFYSETQIDEMRNFCLGRQDYGEDIEGDTKTKWIYSANKFPILAPFFEDPRVISIAKTIIGEDAVQLRSGIQYKDKLGRTGAFDQYLHTDSWRHRLKFFLYLTDVTDETGPLIYTPGTVYGLWKFFHDLEMYTEIRTGSSDTLNQYVSEKDDVYVGTLLPNKASKLLRRLGTKPVPLSGKAGTLVIFDSRGLHMAAPLKQGVRLVLESYWIENGKYL